MSWLRRVLSYIAPRDAEPVPLPAAARAPEPQLWSPSEYVLYDTWRSVPDVEWSWRSFSPAELACKGSGVLRIRRRALDALQALRQDVGRPMVIASGYRSPAHNQRVGGSKNSRHMHGDAFDVVMTGHNPATFAAAAKRAGFTGFGYYPDATPPFMHIDMGPPRTWGAPIPREA